MIPVKILQGDTFYPVEKIAQIPTPFKFVLKDGNEFTVPYGVKPFFLTRKRMKISKGLVEKRYVHRYCVGYETNAGLKVTHWVYPNGDYDAPGEPSN
jgi:hypothetical protein